MKSVLGTLVFIYETIEYMCKELKKYPIADEEQLKKQWSILEMCFDIPKFFEQVVNDKFGNMGSMHDGADKLLTFFIETITGLTFFDFKSSYVAVGSDDLTKRMAHTNVLKHMRPVVKYYQDKSDEYNAKNKADDEEDKKAANDEEPEVTAVDDRLTSLPHY